MRTVLKSGKLPPNQVRVGQLCNEWQAAFPIRLFRRGDVYAVQYGQQLDFDLTYAEAAAKLGEAQLHALQLEGALD